MTDPDAVLREIEAAARREYLPIAGAEKAALIRSLVESRRPCSVVEVGVLTGYLTVAMASRLAEGCRVIGIELSSEMVRRAEENIAAAGLGAHARIVRGDAREALAGIPGPVDMLVLDAERSQYLSALKVMEPKLAPGAIVAAFVSEHQDAKMLAYMAYVRENGRYENETHVFPDGAVEVSILIGR